MINTNEIEMAVLGCVILDNDLIDELLKYDETYFYSTSSKKLFNLISEIHKSGSVVDDAILSGKACDEELKLFLCACVDTVVSSASFQYYLKHLIECKIKRDIKQLGELSQTLDLNDLPAAIEILNQKIAEIQPEKIEPSLKEQLDEILQNFEELKLRGDDMDFGIPELDNRVVLRRKRTYVLGGRPGNGKTTFAVGLCSRIAYTKKLKVLFFGLEPAKISIFGILTSILTDGGLPAYKIHRPKFLGKEDFVHLTNTRGKLANDPNFEIVDGNWNLSEMVVKIKNGNYDFIVIDHFQRIQFTRDKYAKKYDALEENFKTLMQLAKDKNFCLFVLSHIPTGKDVNMFAGTKALENETDCAMIIKRPDVKDTAIFPRPDGYAEISVNKERLTGNVGKVKLLMNKNSLRFKEYTEFGGTE